MSVKVKRLTLWRREDANRPGLLADILEPLAESGADLKVMMGYRLPGHENRAVVELAPVTGAKRETAARSAGLEPATSIPTLIVEGDNHPGLGSALSREMARAGIDMAFLMAQVVGDRYSAVIGFATEGDARQAEGLVKQATRALEKRVRPARRPAARKKAARKRPGRRR